MEILAAPGSARDPLAGEKPGLGPGRQGGAGAGGAGGIGYVDAPGAGSRPENAEALAALRPAPGIGLGAGRGDSVGTAPSGRGSGPGAELPGTGGEGLGYGAGRGVGIGNGAGSGVGDGEGHIAGSGRGVPFGDVRGLLRGGGGGDGGDGGGSASGRPEGAGRGEPFAKPAVGADDRGSVRVVYLLDVSMSMKEGDKFGQAKRALKQALSELRPSDSFNIVYFFEDVYAFGLELTTALPASVERAHRFVDRIGLGPGTNLSAALSYALKQKNATDLYLLSDGEPNRGIEDPNRLRKLVREGNSRLGAHISTLALGLGEHFKGMELLRRIAEENEGRFRYVNLRDGAVTR